MVKLLVSILFIIGIVFQNQAQEKISSDGANLAGICNDPTKCNYIVFQDIIYFPYIEDKEWQIENMEVAIKNTGDFIITGDLHVFGKDTAAILQLEILFFDEDAKTIHIFKIDEFEFYNEPLQAEPIVFSGKLPDDVKDLVKFADLGINGSKRVPYYEISSNCYQPCKASKLKEEMKIFRKIK